MVIMTFSVKPKYLFVVLFIFISFLDVLGLLMKVSLLELIAKPLIILSLMAIYISSVKKKNYWFLTALFFSFLGDVFLLDKNNMFLLGIAAFLITQLIYIKIIMGHLEKSTLANKMTAILPFAGFFLVLIYILFENLDGYLWPVVIYGLTISMFGVVSLLNYITKKTTSTRLLLLGALLFIASDSMIALNKFYEPQEFYSVLIMITYILAQYLICNYMISKSTTI